MNRWTHVLAVLVGAARPDGDVYAHFGSTLAFTEHLAVTKRLGLIRDAPGPVADDAPEFVLTDSGRAFVERFRLTELPAGRANNWPLRHSSLLEPADAELTRLHTAFDANRAPSTQDGTP